MLKGVFGDRHSRIITLQRRKKQQHVRNVDTGANPDTIAKPYGYVTCLSLAGASILSLNVGGLDVPVVRQCT